VVDDHGEPVPFGATGELVIAGVGLGRYLDSELDALRFPPIAALGFRRAYRSGDLARECPGGLEFLGRRDDQVKIGGRRIELGEIEAQLRAAPGVRAAAVAVRQSASGNSILVGYAVGDVTPAEVRSFLAERLPAGIVPVVVQLHELPMKSSGKLDREALPWPPPSSNATGGGAWSTTRKTGLSDTAEWLAEQ
jgi:acyl-coenzyme A synthetase/AMP-(fatty) acid ligase